MLEQLIESYRRYYDISEGVELHGIHFDFAAYYSITNSRYFAMQSLQYYSFSNYENVYFKSYDRFSITDFNDLQEFAKNYMESFTPSGEGHMETAVTLIVVSKEKVDQLLRSAFRRLNPDKSFRFGLDGWIKIKLLLLEEENKSITTNRYARKDKTSLQKIIQ